ncbi:MAG: SDR family NAD(P)-dependent oxidoreductase [Candidatus Aenigmarchaeota archaeon]|nr:SDR family NAD(P)-dependent oxidoreductase [Candidatus Aenigmarchaeota archaeon]
MKILVTGGAGFIGSHLSRRLLKDGHQVVILDNLSTGKKEYLHKDVTFIKGDIRDPLDIAKAMKGVEAVFHLAALKNVRDNDPDLDFQVNYLAAQNVFDLAKKVKAKIIFTSSAAVYGDVPVPTAETAPCKPKSQYGKSKLRAEKLLAPENSFIVRLFNVYGPLGSNVLNDFCKKIPLYEDVTIFGTGLQTRDYVHVTDVVEALVLGLTYNGLYNVGTGQELSLLSLVDAIKKISNAEPHVKFATGNDNEIARSRADITKIKTELQWEPKVSLQKGIEQLVALAKER